MNNIEKKIVTVYCTADFRSDRCPAMIRDNDHATVISACLRCEHSTNRLSMRGETIAEVGNKEMNERKEYVTGEDVKS